jgi:hypothetical protein
MARFVKTFGIALLLSAFMLCARFAASQDTPAPCDRLLPVASTPLMPARNPRAAPKQDPKQAEETKRLSALCAGYIEHFPLVLLDEHENTNWADVSFTTLALYPDGTIIYWDADDRVPLKGKYLTARLPADEARAFVSQFEGNHAPASYNFPRVTIISDPDFSTFHLLVREAGEFPPRDVFGSYLLRLTGKFGDSRGIPEALRFLASFHYSPATEWTPEVVEVNLLPLHGKKTDAPVVSWPAELPQLESAESDPGGESYRIRLSCEQFLRLKPLLDSRTPRQPFVLSGKTFSVRVRYLFPHQLFAPAAPPKAP